MYSFHIDVFKNLISLSFKTENISSNFLAILQKKEAFCDEKKYDLDSTRDAWSQ